MYIVTHKIITTKSVIHQECYSCRTVEVRQGLYYALRALLVAFVSYYAGVHVQVQLAAENLIFSRLFYWGFRGAQLLNRTCFLRANITELKSGFNCNGYIAEPLVRLVRRMVDTFNDGGKYFLLIYNSY